MNFYDQNPGVKDAFARAGQPGSNGNASAIATDNMFPNQPSAPTSGPTSFAPTPAPQPSANEQMFNAPQDEPTRTVANPWSASGAPLEVPMDHQWNPFSISGYEDGGPVGYDLGGSVDTDNDAGSEPDNDLDDALAAVQDAFEFGKQKHGLGGQQQASAIPAAPGNPSDSGAPRPLPMPGPLPPTSNPFGKRNNPFPAGKTASAIPMVPGNPSDSGLPRPLPEPGPLPPTSNPFGKRTSPPPRGLSQAEPEDTEDEAA